MLFQLLAKASAGISTLSMKRLMNMGSLNSEANVYELPVI